MTTAAIVIASIILFLLYTALTNGVFKRCPHCGKIGSWRYDKIGHSVDEKDADDVLVRSTQQLRCRRCKELVTEVWSDFEGRAFLKEEGTPNQTNGR